VGRYPLTTCLSSGPPLPRVALLPIGLSYFQTKLSPVWIPQLFSNLVIIYLLAYKDGTDRVFRNVSI